MPNYILVTQDERSFEEHYRVVEPDECLSKLSDLGGHTGAVSRAISTAFSAALSRALEGTPLSTGYAFGSDWGAVENNYYGLGLDYDHFFED